MRRSSEMGPVLKRAVAAAATLAFVAVACGGCSSRETKGEGKGGEKTVAEKPAEKPAAPPAPVYKSDDLPVPQGFAYDAAQSHVSLKGARNLRLVYRRDDFTDLDQAASFYKNALAVKGWDLQFQFGFERRGLIFWKGFEELRITIDTPWRCGYTTATLEVEPKEPTESSPAEVQATVARRGE